MSMKRKLSKTKVEEASRQVTLMSSQNFQRCRIWVSSRNKLPQLQLPPNEAHTLAAEPFQPLVEELKRLNQDDPQLAHQAAQIVRLYRLLYESYVARKSESQRLEKANGELRTANLQLCQESEFLKGRYAEQEEELAYFGQAFDKLSTGIGSLLVDSEGCSSEPLLDTGVKVGEESS
ncbi:hypothetical protein N7460_012268 [Penicillium canescens]|uniref:Uncharacterized protein n=1 Tax=Penicillium canescens TaxID=5083 RepID=A0AAD6I244_PENCN|nr:hypothetical protein N7460_012268 [Penicillium canescens]KAJ6040727.1 hypothetical protein N7444_009632 [Penicillium canescens]